MSRVVSTVMQTSARADVAMLINAQVNARDDRTKNPALHGILQDRPGIVAHGRLWKMRCPRRNRLTARPA